MSTLRERAAEEGISEYDLAHLDLIIKGKPEATTWFAARRLRAFYELISHADQSNRQRLEGAYPATCEVIMVWHNTRLDQVPAVFDEEDEDDPRREREEQAEQAIQYVEAHRDSFFEARKQRIREIGE